MKSLVLLVLTVLAASAAVVKCYDSQQVSKACLAEARVTEAELKDFFANGMKPGDARDNIKCYMKCMMEKKGHLKNGVFDEAATLKSFREVPQLRDHQQEVEKAVRECKNERGTNDCDTAFKITTCIKEYKSAMSS